VLDVVYTCLLIAVALSVTWYCARVVRRLYRDED